jgi:serine phosphatase RsbU (regulator of sigma subunit)
MGDGNEVGGDFYDLFESGGAWAAVIGDVCGKGAEAAALTALARHGVLALGRDGAAPSRVLAELNEVIVRERGLQPRFSTVAYARLERDGDAVTATVASAGHPLPLVVRASGRVEPVGRPGTLIGPFASIRVNDETAVLAPGDALVLFTDGVTEARRAGRLFGDARLRRLLAGTAGRPADEIARRIEEAVVAHHGGPLADDLAVLVVRVAR